MDLLEVLCQCSHLLLVCLLTRAAVVQGLNQASFYQSRLLLESTWHLRVLCCLLVSSVFAKVPFCLLTNFPKVET